MSSKEFNVVLYGRKTCKYCKLSEELLNKLKKDGVNIKKRYLNIDLERNKSILNKDKRVPEDYIFVPKIVINDKFIGGFDNLSSFKFI